MISAALCHDDSIPERVCGVASTSKVPQVTPCVVADVTIHYHHILKLTKS